MKTAKTFSVSLPPELAEEIDELSDQEGLSRSELTRLALRRYIKSNERWKLLRKWGEKSAQKLGLEDEQDVAELTENFREENRE